MRPYLFELLFLLMTAGIAYYHSRLIFRNRAITHQIWAIVSESLAVLCAAFSGHFWAVLVALTFIRYPVFNILLNRFRTPRKPWNYIATTYAGGSKIDAFVGDHWPYVYGLCGGIFLAVQIYWL